MKGWHHIQRIKHKGKTNDRLVTLNTKYWLYFPLRGVSNEHSLENWVIMRPKITKLSFGQYTGILGSPKKTTCNLKLIIFKLISTTAALNFSCEIACILMPQDFIDDQSTLNLVPSSNKSLHAPMLTRIYITKWRLYAAMSGGFIQQAWYMAEGISCHILVV